VIKLMSKGKYFGFAFSVLIIGFFMMVIAADAVVVETGHPQTVTTTSQVSDVQAGPAPFSIVVVPQKQKIYTGEKINVDVFIASQPGVKAVGPVITQPFGDWVVVAQVPGVFKQNKSTGAWERKDKLTLMTFLDGKVEIPALNARVQVPNSGSMECRSVALTVEVEPKVNKKGELEASVKDIKKPIWMISIWQIVLAVLIALVLLALITWYSRKSGILNLGSKQEPIRPPEEIARKKLKALKNSNYLESGNFKEYYIELTNIIRQYLEGRYFISALDRTTSELMRELKRILDRKDAADFRDLLERSDVIKFAKGSPDSKEIEIDWNLVNDFVDKTTQIFIDSQKSLSKSDEDQSLDKSGNNFTSLGRKS